MYLIIHAPSAIVLSVRKYIGKELFTLLTCIETKNRETVVYFCLLLKLDFKKLRIIYHFETW